MKTLHTTVTVDAAELREWAGKHADAGHHGVAHVLYLAAEGIESVTEQHDRETAARAWDEGWKACAHAAAGSSPHHDGPRNPYREVTR